MSRKIKMLVAGALALGFLSSAPAFACPGHEGKDSACDCKNCPKKGKDCDKKNCDCKGKKDCDCGKKDCDCGKKDKDAKAPETK